MRTALIRWVRIIGITAMVYAGVRLLRHVVPDKQSSDVTTLRIAILAEAMNEVLGSSPFGEDRLSDEQRESLDQFFEGEYGRLNAASEWAYELVRENASLTSLPTADTDADGSHTSRREYVDQWRNPLVVIPRSRMDAFRRGEVGVCLSNGRVVRPRPYVVLGDDGRPLGRGPFQIYSCGPDGLPNTADDLEGYGVYE